METKVLATIIIIMLVIVVAIMMAFIFRDSILKAFGSFSGVDQESLESRVHAMPMEKENGDTIPSEPGIVSERWETHGYPV